MLELNENFLLTSLSPKNEISDVVVVDYYNIYGYLFDKMDRRLALTNEQFYEI